MHSAADSLFLPGVVYFAGAGPGDPLLLTLKTQRLIESAGLILYAGSLVSRDVLTHAQPGAEIFDTSRMALAEQVQRMAGAARQGQIVARLHTGDPSIYGSILEQMDELDQLNIPYRVIPGVSSAFAAAAALGLEYTVPGITQTVIFTRLAGETPVPEAEDLRDLAAHHCSLVIFLSAGMTGKVAAQLQAAGYPPETPAAVVYRASWPDERRVQGTLANIEEKTRQAGITHQALIIISPALAADQKGRRSYLYSAERTAATAAVTDASPSLSPEPAPQIKTASAKQPLHIISLTRRGFETGERLRRYLPGSTHLAALRFVPPSNPAGVTHYTGKVAIALQRSFSAGHPLICVMASGVAVRALAPLLADKRQDPPVVVVDEGGQFAVSLCGGHLGGANDLARQAASILGATPVITTASDSQGLPALDLIGQDEGWLLERAGQLTAVSAALVNGEQVGVFQDAGDEDWLPNPLPANLTRSSSLEALQQISPAAAVVISARQVPDSFLIKIPKTILYRPPCLALGIGCNRNTPAAEILQAVDETLALNNLSPMSVALAASVTDKQDETGMLEACAQRGWRLHFFSREALTSVGNLPNPSPGAQKALGIPGVAEPSALLASGGGKLIVTKRKYKNVTVAVAMIFQAHEQDAMLAMP